MSNLDIWGAVEITDPSATKPYKGAGGFEGTAINFTATVKKATEQFGPIGTGWGYEIVEERFDEGGVIMEKNEALGQNVEIGKHIMHTIRLKLWVMVDGNRSEVEHFGHTPYVYKNKWGIQTDMEAPKKSLTDAIKKCLSMFGFSADVFLGLFDDREYVESQRERENVDKADNQAERAIAARQEWDDKKAEYLEQIKTSPNLKELEIIFTGAIRKGARKEDQEFIKMATAAKDQRKGELSEAA